MKEEIKFEKTKIFYFSERNSETYVNFDENNNFGLIICSLCERIQAIHYFFCVNL